MKKVRIGWVGVLLLLLQLPVFGQNNLSVEYGNATAVPDFLNICGDSDAVEVRVSVEGLALETRSRILATLHLFKGTQFVSLDSENSTVGVTLVDATDLSNPVFSLPDLSPTGLQNLEIAYSIAANCTVIDTLIANDQVMVFDTWEFSYSLGNEDNITEIDVTAEYRDAFAIPNFTIEAQNSFGPARVGDCFSRNIIVNNSALDGFVSQLAYRNMQQTGVSIESILVNGLPIEFFQGLAASDAIIQMDITGDYFRDNLNGNGDEFFDPDETLIITEMLCVESCNDGRQSFHSVSWGCYDRMCQEVNTVDFVEIGEGTANVIIKKRGTAPDVNPGYCTTAQTSLTFINEGVEIDAGFATMYDVETGIGIGSGFQLSSDGYTITNLLIGNVMLNTETPLISLNNNPSFNTDPDGPGGLSDLDGDGFFDDLGKGEAFEIIAFYELDCSQTRSVNEENCTNDFSVAFNARLDYTNQCQERLIRVQPSFFRPANNNSGFENFTDPDADLETDIFFITHTESRTIRNFDISCNDEEVFVASVALPSGVMPVVEQTRLLKNGSTEIPLLDSEVRNDSLFLTFAATATNFLLGEYALRMAFQADCSAQTGATIFPFTFELVCPPCDCRHLWFCDDLSGPILHANNPPCDNVVDCDNGMQTTDFEINRTTFGYTDNTFTTKIAPTDANRKVAIACDSVEMRVKSVVGDASLTDDIGVVLEYANADGSDSPIQTFLFNEGKAIFTVGGQNFECPITTENLDLTIGDGDRSLDFQLGSCLQNLGLTLSEGDEVEFIGNFYVNPEGPYQNQFRNVPNLRGYGYAIANGETIICDSYGANFTLAKTNTVFDFPNTNFFPNGCEVEPLQYRLITINNGFNQFFPNEFRRAVAVDSLVFNYDPSILNAFDNINLEVSIPGHPVHGNSFFPLPPLTDFPLGTYTARFDSLLRVPSYNVVSSYAFNLRMNVTPSCESQTSSENGDNRYRFDPTIYYQDRFYANFIGDGSCSPKIVDAREDEILYEEPPQFSFAPFGVSNYRLLGDTAVWTIQHCNTSFESDATVTFIAVEDTTGTIEVLSFEDISDANNPMTLIAATYEGEGNNFFAFTPQLLRSDGQNALSNICNTIRIKALVKRCGETSFKVKSGWNCAPFPSDWNPNLYAPCEEQELDLQVTTLEPFLDANIVEQPAENPAICDESAVTILLRNTDIGTAFNVRTRLVLPPNGASLVPNSVEIAYPSNAPFQAATGDPILVADNDSGKIYEYADFSNLNAQLAESGLPGFNPGNPGAMNEFRIRYRFQTDCGFESGGLLFYNFQGVKGCGDLSNFEAGETLPIVINGTEGDFSKLLEVVFSPNSNLAGGTNSDLTINVVNRTTTPTDTTDMVVLIVPQGITYVANSTNNNFNEPRLSTDSDGRQVITWDLPVGLAQNEVASLNFALSAPNVECNEEGVGVILKTVSTEELLCDRTGVPCTVETLTSTTGDALINLPTNRSAISFSIDEFFSNCLDAQNETVTVRGSLTGNGETINTESLTIRYYYDANGNGLYDINEPELANFTEVNTLSENGSLAFEHNFTVTNSQICGVIIKLDTDNLEEICGIAELNLDTPRLNNAGTDIALCPLETTTVELGIGQEACAANSTYEYNWSAVEPATLDNFSDLKAPNPTVNITHDGQSVEVLQYVLQTTRPNCGMTQDTVTITLGIGIDITPPDPLQIAAGETISLQPEITGGTPPLTYQWEPAETLNDASNPTPLAQPNEDTQYRLIVTDASGCSAEAIFPVFVGNALSVNAGVDQTICVEGNVRLNAIAIGGTAPYTYAWSPMVQADETTSQPLVNPSLTTDYEVTVTDANGFTATDIVTIIVEDCGCISPTVTAVNTIPSTCGNEEGSAIIELDMPAMNYSYTWTPESGQPRGVGNQRTNLPFGGYRILIQSLEEATCTTETTVLIQNADGPQATFTTTSTDCASFSGSVNLMPANYNYTWEDGSTLTERNDLSAGTYFVTFTDPTDPDCPNVIQVDISEDNPLEADVIVNTQPDCGEPNGSVTINVRGGSGDYNYSWEGGRATRNNLRGGIYTLTVTDNQAATCEIPVIFVLTDDVPPAIISNGTPNNISCAGANDGSLDYQIDFNEAFTPPADTLFSNGIRNFENGSLPTGQMCVVIRDGNNCVAGGFCFEIEEPAALSVNLNATESCENDGTIRGNISGGTAPYTINWGDQAGTDNELERSDLAVGNYSMTITDANGCILENTVIVPACFCQPPIVTTVTTTPVECGLTNGTAALELPSPQNYNYIWQPDLGVSNDNGNARTGLPLGGYTVEIIDEENPACSNTITLLIESTEDLGIEQMTTPATCDADNGTAILTPANFTYEWSDGEVGNGRMNLAAATYFVTVTDPEMLDCPNVVEVEIQDANPLVAEVVINNRSTCGVANGSVTINVTGGSGDYSFSWTSGTDTQENLAAGTYTVTVTDNSETACELPVIFVLTDDVPEAVVIPAGIRNVSCAGGSDGRFDFAIDFAGDFVEPAAAFITNGIQQFINGNLPAGSYCLQVNDANGCVAGGFCFEIEEPEPLRLDVDLTLVCESTGAIEVTASGGTAPYLYDWADLEGTDNPSTREGLDIGTFRLNLTDANGCTLAENNISLDSCVVCEIFPEEYVAIQAENCEETAKFCFDIEPADVPNYSVTDNGEMYPDEFGRCEFDTLGIYSFVTLLNSAGPYELTAWTINGETFSTTFMTIPDLVDSMNVFDTRGSWELDENGLLARGGFSGNTYSSIDVVNGDGVSASLGYNVGFFPSGYSLNLTVGLHNLVFTNAASGCTEMIQVDVKCTTTDTIRIDLEVDEMKEICFDSDELSGPIDTIYNACPIMNADFMVSNDSCVIFTGIQGGEATACVVTCDEFMVCDTTFIIVNVMDTGIVDTIVVGQTNTYCVPEDFPGLIADIAMINNVCPEESGTAVQFELDQETFCVDYTGLELGTEKACIEVCDVQGICDTFDLTITVVEGNVIYDTIFIDQDNEFFCLENSVPGNIVTIEDRCPESNGENVDFGLNLVTNCVTYTGITVGQDTACVWAIDDLGNEVLTTFFITVVTTTPEYIQDTVFINQTKMYCADTTELSGRINFIDNFCPEESGEFVDFFLDPNTMCVEYTGVEIGQDSACIVFCDINGYCDTTFITVTVVEFLDLPTAVDDEAETDRGMPVVIDVKANDTIFGGIDTAFIAVEPLYGTARFNLDCSVTYEPDERFCDRFDEFQYVVCNPNGCDTATVTVFINCVGIFIFNAVSPNGDGMNDVFYIAGLNDKPENNLEIYNRWGNLVYQTDNYQNTWGGEWDGDKELPDGTYFYIFRVQDNDEEVVFRGYLELYR